MATDGFELYHVPQQSRREKLRENLNPSSVSGSASGSAPGPFPVYDPSDLLTFHHHHHHHNRVVKEEEERAANLMTSHQQNPLYFDPQSSIQINPNSSIHDVTNHFPYALQSFADVTNNGGGGCGQGLSLSLSSQHHRSYESVMYGNVPAVANDVSCRNAAAPLGPFTGYASILKGSRFLRPAQQLLEEFCDLGKGVLVEKIAADESLMDHPDCVDGFSGEGGELRRKKSMLISMLEEVLRRYKQYYHHMQAVMASFESVAGLSNAAPYANLALKVMSKHFRTLKNAITEQLQCTDKVHGKDDAPNGSSGDRGGGGCYGLNSGFNNEHQPVWRPQRGLPERAVVVLRAWLFEHFLHPYPTDTDKLILAKQTGLSRNQVSNWFINARVRLWKPMVEEIHMLETRQTTQKIPQRDEINNYTSTDDPSTSSKRSRNEVPHLPLSSKEPTPVSYYMPTSHQNLEAGGRGSGVSLTLGLSEPFPIDTARRFGVGGLDGYVMSGFEAPNNQHFGRDVMGGQLLHDFVG